MKIKVQYKGPDAMADIFESIMENGKKKVGSEIKAVKILFYPQCVNEDGDEVFPTSFGLHQEYSYRVHRKQNVEGGKTMKDLRCSVMNLRPDCPFVISIHTDMSKIVAKDVLKAFKDAEERLGDMKIDSLMMYCAFFRKDTGEKLTLTNEMKFKGILAKENAYLCTE